MKAFRKALNNPKTMRVFFLIGLYEFVIHTTIMIFNSDHFFIRVLVSFWFVWSALTFIRWQLLLKQVNSMIDKIMDNYCGCGKRFGRLDDKPVCMNCGNNVTAEDLQKVAQRDHFPDNTELAKEMRRIWINRVVSSWGWDSSKRKTLN